MYNYIEKKVEELFSLLDKYPGVLLWGGFMAILGTRLFFTSYTALLHSDGVAYLVKAFEIARGDFSPMQAYAIGWPLLLGIFVKLFHVTTFDSGIILTRVLAAVTSALVWIPLYYIAREIVGRESRILFLLAGFFMFDTVLIDASYTAWTEPLFMLLLMMMTYMLMRGISHTRYLYIAAALAGVAYYVRFNGFFLLLTCFAYMTIQYGRATYSKEILKKGVLMGMVFVVVSIPNIYLREKAFGTAFDYGYNSRYFIEHPRLIDNINAPNPSLVEYLKTHPPVEWFAKFGVHGFFSILHDYIKGNLFPRSLLVFLLIGIYIYIWDRRFSIIFTVITVWIIGLTLPWSVFTSPRYLVPTLPFLFIITAAAVEYVSRTFPYKHAAIIIVAGVFIVFSLKEDISMRHNAHASIQSEMPVWARWTAEHVRGKLAMIDGADLVMINLLDVRVGGTMGHTDMIAPRTGLSTTLAGAYETVDMALEDFYKEGITHIGIPSREIIRKKPVRPYLIDIKDGRVRPECFTTIFSAPYNAKTDDTFDIVEINWSHTGCVPS